MTLRGRARTLIVVVSVLIVLGIAAVAFSDEVRTWVMGSEGPETQAEDASHMGRWSYAGPTGPAYWADLKAEYAACKEGQQQSPVDLAGAVRGTLPPLQFHYAPTPLEIVNNGHTIQINYAPGSTLTVDGRQYELLQFHFHSQSEHTVGGQPLGMEAHLVHRNAQGRLAVVGVFMQEGAPNAFLQPIWSNLSDEEDVRSIPGVTVNIADFLPKDQSYYRYPGSLTTPPCTEGVAWYMLQTPVEVSADQIAQFAALFPPTNARPVQPLYGRPVHAST